jgi:hypothetical protein
MKRIAILGEIGSGNLGDDFGYVLLRDALTRAFEELDVLVDIRPMTPNLFGLLDSYHWDAVLTGCGTLLDLGSGPYVRMLLAAAQRCPVAIAGSGLADPRHVAPTASGRDALHELLAQAKHAWTRVAPEGCDPATAAPDPAWLYGWHGDSNPRNGVGINVGYAAFSTLRLDPSFLITLDAFRSAAPFPTALIAAWHADSLWLDRLCRPGEPIYTIDGTRRSMLVLSGFRAVIATRIHLAVMAACHGAFPILPDYTTKVRDVFAGVASPHTIVNVNCGPRGLIDAVSASPVAPSGGAAIAAASTEATVRVRAVAEALAGAWS